MPRYSQTAKGSAFEYALARAFIDVTPAEAADWERPFLTARNHFQSMDKETKDGMQVAAREAVAFLCAFEERLNQSSTGTVHIQSSQDARKRADVRDIVFRFPEGELGISAKNISSEVRAPRLSDTIDFGAKWLGIPVSQRYWNEVKPIFQSLRHKRSEGILWREIEGKEEIYFEVLQAFRNEIMRIHESEPGYVPEQLVRFILGRYDFYQITKENGFVSIASFNLANNLGWGNKVPLPNRILSCDFLPDSKSTLLLALDSGWQIRFRLHNASSKVEPSLKFSITIEGWPKVIARHIISLDPKHRITQI